MSLQVQGTVRQVLYILYTLHMIIIIMYNVYDIYSTGHPRLKATSFSSRFKELFDKYAKAGDRELKLKRPGQMKEVLDMTRELIVKNEAESNMENMDKLKVLKSVLEM